MKKIKTKAGYVAYECTAEEVAKLGGRGICDHCGNFSKTGYLVPVINRYICPKCFNEFNETSTYYKEDIPVETRNCQYYESMIGVED